MQERLLKNALSVIVVRSSLIVVAAVETVLYIRYLGVKSFGVFNTAINLYSVFFPLALFGFGSVITREIGKDPSRAWIYAVNVFYSGIGMCLLWSLGLFGFCLIMQYNAAITATAMILILGLFPNYVTAHAEAVFIGLGKVKTFAALNAIFAVVEVILIFAVLQGPNRLTAVAWVIVGVRAGFSVFTIWLLTREVRPGRLTWDIPFSLRLLKPSLIFALIGIMSGLLFRMGVLYMAKMTGDFATGIYSSAQKIVIMWGMVITSFVVTSYPIAAKCYAEGDREKFQAHCREMAKNLSLLVYLAIILTICLSQELVRVLFKTEYLPAAGVLNGLIFWLIPICGTAWFGAILAASNRQIYDLVAVTVAAGAGLVLNYFWIRQWGIYGCVGAVIAAFFIILAIQGFFIYRRVQPLRLGQAVLKPLLIFALTLGLLYWLRAFPWYARLPLVVAVYSGLAFGTGLLGRKELRSLSDLLKITGGDAVPCGE
jgi:O-antigen/teichoic acid export membrane protein